MARPQKQGLDYFALDVKMSDEVEIIEAEHGLEGFSVLIKLFQKIYSEGYYYHWGAKEQILFSNKVSVDRNKVVSIVNDCIKWNIFNKNMYEKYRILTSRRIQNQYIASTYKRVNVEIIKNYLLIDVSDKTNIKIRVSDDGNADTSDISDDGNADTNRVSDDKSTQSKVNKSKVNKNSANSLCEDVFEQLWKLYPNKKGKTAVSKKNQIAIQKVGIEKMTLAINNYKKELRSETWKQPMNGSTFFNGRYQDYLNQEDAELEKQESKYNFL